MESDNKIGAEPEGGQKVFGLGGELALNQNLSKHAKLREKKKLKKQEEEEQN
jgi:hypothetical protein